MGSSAGTIRAVPDTVKKVPGLAPVLFFSTFFYWKGPDFRAPGAPWALPPSGKILGSLRALGALINKNAFSYGRGPNSGPVMSHLKITKYTEKNEVFRAFKPKHSFTFFGQLEKNLR